MTISPWWLLAATNPILLLGELLVARIKPIARFDIPISVLGGFTVAAIVLILKLTGWATITLQVDTAVRWWTWIVTAPSEWTLSPAKPVYLPFNLLFFTCVGLNASWRVVKQGRWQLLGLLAVASLLGVLQNLLGIGMCAVIHQPKILGIICGSLTLTGGPSTAMGFASDFEKAGFPAAGSVGLAASMFGIVTGSLFGGAVGGRLIRKRGLHSPFSAADQTRTTSKPRFLFFRQAARLLETPGRLISYAIVLLICVKSGASLTLWLKSHGVALPVYMGSLLIALVIRNVVDLFRPALFDTEIINRIASVALGIFLAAAIASLDLYKLHGLAGPMMAILSAQVALMVGFASVVTFRVMGSDYESAVASAGHVGFGLGITNNALATMDVLTSKFGPAPRALLMVTIVGAFLIDFTNSVIITLFITVLK